MISRNWLGSDGVSVAGGLRRGRKGKEGEGRGEEKRRVKRNVHRGVSVVIE